MHLPLIYSAALSGYRTENCFMSLSEVSGQLRLEAATDCAWCSISKRSGLKSDQAAPLVIVHYHISIQHPFCCSDELKWQVEMPPPHPVSMIYGKEAKTIIAFLLLLFFQG